MIPYFRARGTCRTLNLPRLTKKLRLFTALTLKQYAMISEIKTNTDSNTALLNAVVYALMWFLVVGRTLFMIDFFLIFLSLPVAYFTKKFKPNFAKPLLKFSEMDTGIWAISKATQSGGVRVANHYPPFVHFLHDWPKLWPIVRNISWTTMWI